MACKFIMLLLRKIFGVSPLESRSKCLFLDLTFCSHMHNHRRSWLVTCSHPRLWLKDLTWCTNIYYKYIINNIDLNEDQSLIKDNIYTNWHILCLSLSLQTSVIPPAGVVVWEMWAGHTGIWMHHVSQLWCGYWKLCAPAGARTQALLQWRSRAGQLGKPTAVTFMVL